MEEISAPSLGLLDTRYVKKTGDTMTGDLILERDGSHNLLFDLENKTGDFEILATGADLRISRGAVSWLLHTQTSPSADAWMETNVKFLPSADGGASIGSSLRSFGKGYFKTFIVSPEWRYAQTTGIKVSTSTGIGVDAMVTEATSGGDTDLTFRLKGKGAGIVYLLPFVHLADDIGALELSWGNIFVQTIYLIGDKNAIIKADNVAATDKTFQFPNASGTIALQEWAANKALSNLASVQINTNLVFQDGAGRTIKVDNAAIGFSGDDLSIVAGRSAPGRDGGHLYLSAGVGIESMGGGSGGNVYIAGGGTSGGVVGNIYLGNPATNINVILDLSNITTADKTLVFPNASGVLALQGLAGEKVYYVADASGGSPTRKLTFTNGVLTAET